MKPMTLLYQKHPEPAECHPDSITSKQPVVVHPDEEITAESIRTAALNTHGGSGPSGMDADGWRHILASRMYSGASDDLRKELAKFIKQLCTEKIHLEYSESNITSSLEAFLACRLIPLDKNPGLRPIGVGEVLRRIAGKVVMTVIKTDVEETVGSLQVCGGQSGGCEAAIHAMRTIYEEESTDAILLIDAANAFNSVNRAAMLQNIQRLCPIAYTYAFNCYAPHARLFVIGGQEIKSREGTTQGDPPAMAFYAIGLLPLLTKISQQHSAEQQQSTNHAAYADDLVGGGILQNLRKWFDDILEYGPMYGYNAEPTKSWLIVKEEQLQEAKNIFNGVGVNITTRGKKHLGAVIGETDYKVEFVENIVQKWVDQVTVLSQIATFEPQAAYTAFVTCLRHRYTFYMRTISDISTILRPLEQAIKHKLIPALTEGRQCTSDERLLLSLPVRLGGMGLINPCKISDAEYEASKHATTSLTQAIIRQQVDLPENFTSETKNAKAEIRQRRRADQKQTLEQLKLRMTSDQVRTNEINCEKGASNWLTTLPFEDKGFLLSKREFWDAILLRYNWPIPRLPSTCACHAKFDVSHALCHVRKVALSHNVTMSYVTLQQTYYQKFAQM